MAFTDTARIQYYNQNNEMKSYTRDEFAKLVNSGNQWNAQVSIEELKLTGNAANATVQILWGENQKNKYIDYLNLIYDGDSWHITNKVAQFVDNSAN